MISRVSVRNCQNYDPDRLSEALQKTVDDLGGMQAFVKSGDRVLLKPNLLKSAAPEEAVVTHPAIVESVASMVKDCGARLFIGDSPPMGNLRRVLSKSGYDPFMKRIGVQAVPFTDKIPRECPEGRLFRRIDLAKEAFEFDAVINLPKLKTHCQMLLTLAVKNLFGTVVGPDKATWHFRAGRDFETFATALVQIYEQVRPTISILDGILSMEGNGPNAGEPRHVGIVAASADAVALDAVICRLVGYGAENLLTCVIGRKLGVGATEESEIELTGDRLTGFPLKDFKLPKSLSVTWNLASGGVIRKFLEKHLVTRPDIDASECRACGVCLKHCPPQAISEENGVMMIDRDKCISCFCCHELCSNDAVRIVQPLLGKIVASISR